MSTPAVHILLLRHGQTDANAQGIMQGQMQTPLNALGHQQAAMLARGVMGKGLPVVRLVSSDLQRAVQTAEPVSRSTGLPIQVIAEWRERCFGAMEGQPANHADTWRLASGELNPPGCEPMADFLDRICGAMNHLAESGLTDVGRSRSAGIASIESTNAPVEPSPAIAEPAIAVVTHGGCIRAVLRLLIDGRLALPENMDRPPLVPIANCSIMHLRVTVAPPGSNSPYQWELIRLNDVTHLGEQATLTDAG